MLLRQLILREYPGKLKNTQEVNGRGYAVPGKQ